jgi:YHS domain-containing protein
VRTKAPLLKSAVCLIVLGIAAMLTGCSGPTEKPVQQKPSSAPATGNASDKNHADVAAAGLAELSAADRAIAEKQKVCPVSGEILGEHGKPYKITVKGQTVFLCCSGCEEMIKKNPDKYLAKLKAKGSK